MIMIIDKKVQYHDHFCNFSSGVKTHSFDNRLNFHFLPHTSATSTITVMPATSATSIPYASSS
jgi:hypothetical protein